MLLAASLFTAKVTLEAVLVLVNLTPITVPALSSQPVTSEIVTTLAAVAAAVSHVP
jgi:hypothetical protein